MNFEAWLQLKGTSFAGLLALYGSGVLGILVRSPHTYSRININRYIN